MLSRLLPKSADNTYRGHKLALVLLGLVLFVKTAISLGSIFNGYTATTSADGIPIDTYGPAGAQTVLSIVAALGLANVIICLIGIVVLIRYRSLVPFMFAILFVQQLARELVLELLPIARTGAPPGVSINLVMLIVMAVGLVLSLWPRTDHHPG